MRNAVKKSAISLVVVFLFLLVGGAILNSAAPDGLDNLPGVSTTVEDKEPITPPATLSGTKTQENALASAEQYLGFSGFSKAGLMRQLTSDAGEGFSKKDATWALKHVEVDWNAEAVQTAETYQEIMSMSRVGLIRQMTSKTGDQFTTAQAEYAADKVGL